MTCQACYNGSAIAVMANEKQMSYTTYTLLVTIAHDAGAAPSTELLETMVQRGLGEGVREMAGVESATVSALAGDALGFPLNKKAKVYKVRELHSAIAA